MTAAIGSRSSEIRNKACVGLLFRYKTRRQEIITNNNKEIIRIEWKLVIQDKRSGNDNMC